ncbi:jg12347 [Pararge aegeria aegeria]|uniref:Jg12347 protein n=1 Tax=Pararge aegeria aegeria TaxID=348720 RepID=A0A8S4RBP7_9NEOP|nr:jg12347 [Pararge aegeria aegeria]
MEVCFSNGRPNEDGRCSGRANVFQLWAHRYGLSGHHLYHIPVHHQRRTQTRNKLMPVRDLETKWRPCCDDGRRHREDIRADGEHSGTQPCSWDSSKTSDNRYDAYKIRQEAIAALRDKISFRHSNPSQVQPFSNNKLRVEFEIPTQQDDALLWIKASDKITAEPSRKINPMIIIMKGLNNDIPSEKLIGISNHQRKSQAV